MLTEVYTARSELDGGLRICHRHQIVTNGEGKATRLVNFLGGKEFDSEVADCQGAADSGLCTQELEHRMR